MSAENIIYDMSLKSELDNEDSKFVDRQYSFVYDSNNGSYAGGSVLLDCSSLTGTDGVWYDWREAVVEIPYVVAINSTWSGTSYANISPYMASLKCGSWNLINSYSLSINGVQVQQQVPFDNMHVSYKMTSTLSNNEVTKLGKTLMFSKDNSQSYYYQSSGSVCGQGFVNNIDTAFTSSGYADISTEYGTLGDVANDGFAKRQNWLSFVPNTSVATVSNIGTTGRTQFQQATSSNTSGAWYVIATLRLKDISPFIANCPLSKNMRVQLTLYVNQANITFNTVTNASAGLLSGQNLPTMSSVTMIGGCTTLPVMIASTQAQNGSASTVIGNNVASTLTLACGVSSVTNKSVTYSHPTLQKCTLYVAGYTMKPEATASYIESLEEGSYKTIVYNELSSYQQYNISANTSFNIQAFNSIVSPQELVICEMVNSASNASLGYNTLLSPYSCAPALCDPLYGNLSNFQCYLSGTAIYNAPIQYNYQQWLYELQKTGLDGSFVSGLTSGQFNQDDCDMGTTSIVVDLSRRVESEDLTPKNIAISGTNNNALAIDLYCFVTRKCKAKLNVLTGSVDLIQY